MLIPRFSLRWLLIVMTVCGVLAYVAAQAVGGQSWGIAVAVALASLLVTAALHILTFLAAWLAALLSSLMRSRRASSPFATESPPPQILPPPDPL